MFIKKFTLKKKFTLVYMVFANAAYRKKISISKKCVKI